MQLSAVVLGEVRNGDTGGMLVMIWGDINCMAGLTGGARKPPGIIKGMPLAFPYGWF